MFIPFGASAYDENDYGLPPARLENWYAQEAPTRPEKPYRLIPTPGVVGFADVLTSGAAYGTFQSGGVLGGDVISVMGTKVCRTTSGGSVTEIGTVAQDGHPAQFAVSQLPELVVAVGGSAYRVNASSLTAITIAEATGPIIGVAQLAQRHLYLEGGTGRVWISDVADCTTVTEFITAERNPDNLLSIAASSDTIWLGGTHSTELAFIPNGDDEFVYLRPGGVIEHGVMGRRAMLATPDGVYAVTGDAVLYRLDGHDRSPLTPTFLTRAIEGLSEADRSKVRLNSYAQSGRRFLHLHIPTVGDYFLDLLTRTWHRRRPPLGVGFGFDFWTRAHGRVYGQRLSSGILVTLDESVATAFGEPVARIASALVPIADRSRIVNIVIDAQEGVGLDGSGYGSAPQLELRMMRDGRTPSDPFIRPMGRHGDFGWRTLFGPLGQARGPVTGFEISMSDPVPYAVYGATANVLRP